MSHIARLYVEAALIEGDRIALDDGASRYLLRVMRLGEGAAVRVFNGSDGEWIGRLAPEGKKAFVIPESQSRQQEVGPNLTLLFAPIKRARTDFIIEKATELGARAIHPILTDYTQANRVRTDRMKAQIIEAAEQTERLDLPEIHDPEALAKRLSKWDQSIPLYYCDEAGGAKPMADSLRDSQSKSGGVLIGPEGGFSPEERKMLRALDFVIPVTLGPRILRAETAVVSALTLWQSLVGDWQKTPYLPES